MRLLNLRITKAAELLRRVPNGVLIDSIPQQMSTFADVGKELVDLFGKPSLAKKRSEDQWIVRASEYVRLVTGKTHDEHLAELYSQFQSQPSANRELDLQVVDALSGDAIRQGRKRFRSSNPVMYEQAIADAVEAANKPK